MSKYWTANHPTIIGNYWFYGWRSAHSRDSLKSKPSLLWVRAKQGGNCLIYYAGNEFLYPEGRNGPMVGLWQEMTFPEIPEDFNERFDYAPEETQ